MNRWVNDINDINGNMDPCTSVGSNDYSNHKFEFARSFVEKKKSLRGSRKDKMFGVLKP